MAAEGRLRPLGDGPEREYARTEERVDKKTGRHRRVTGTRLRRACQRLGAGSRVPRGDSVHGVPMHTSAPTRPPAPSAHPSFLGTASHLPGAPHG